MKREKRIDLDIVFLLSNIIFFNQYDYDFSFYLTESAKAIDIDRDYSNKDDFWGTLNYNFKENVSNLIKFKYIKQENYNSFKSEIDNKQAEIEAKTLVYDFYVKNKNLIKHWIGLKSVLECILLNAVRIKLSSNKNYQKKFDEFVDVMNNLGVFYDRESRIVIDYFKDNCLILNRMQRGSGCTRGRDDLDKAIDNIAWDLFAVRFMEYLMFNECKDGHFYIPVFCSHDSALQKIMQAYQVQAFGCFEKIPFAFLEQSFMQYAEKNGLSDSSLNKITDMQSSRNKNRESFWERLEDHKRDARKKCYQTLGL